MKETWVDIDGYVGLYQVSNLGNIRSFLREGEPRLLTIIVHKIGYGSIKLRYNGIAKKYAIHRLVAIAFIDNPNGKPEVNHIDGNKMNNKVDNLEWVTRSENQYHAYSTGLKKPAKSTRGGKYNSRSKPVLQIISEKSMIHWDGINEAAKNLNLSAGNISAVCLGKLKTCGGFKWQYK